MSEIQWAKHSEVPHKLCLRQTLSAISVRRKHVRISKTILLVGRPTSELHPLIVKPYLLNMLIVKLVIVSISKVSTELFRKQTIYEWEVHHRIHELPTSWNRLTTTCTTDQRVFTATLAGQKYTIAWESTNPMTLITDRIRKVTLVCRDSTRMSANDQGLEALKVADPRDASWQLQVRDDKVWPLHKWLMKWSATSQECRRWIVKLNKLRSERRICLPHLVVKQVKLLSSQLMNQRRHLLLKLLINPMTLSFKFIWLLVKWCPEDPMHPSLRRT